MHADAATVLPNAQVRLFGDQPGAMHLVLIALHVCYTALAGAIAMHFTGDIESSNEAAWLGDVWGPMTSIRPSSKRLHGSAPSSSFW